MATLERLEGDEKLIKCTPMDEDCVPIRSMFLTCDCDDWLNDLVNKTSDRGEEELMDQVLKKIHHYLTAPKVHIGAFYSKSYIWYMRTPDLRIFGFFYRPGVFIAVCGGEKKDIMKADGYKKLFRKTMDVSDRLGLDLPKYMTRTLAADRRINWERIYDYPQKYL